MGNLIKDCNWLGVIVDSYIGLEDYSFSIRSKDFFTYYFKTFVSNVKDHFKQFSRSEIVEFNNRYGNRIKHTLNDPVIPLEDFILPIPKGMIHTYLETTNRLTGLLKAILSDSLISDTDDLIHGLQNPDTSYFNTVKYSKKDFDKDVSDLSETFAHTSLNHVVGNKAFNKPRDVSEVNSILLDYTSHYYPVTISLNQKMKDIEKAYDHCNFTNSNKKIIDESLLSLAYRVSLFSEILLRIQEIEHNFVECLRLLTQNK
jgi:hypothetical protein